MQLIEQGIVSNLQSNSPDYFFLSLFIYLFIYLSIYPSIYLFIYLYIYLFIFLFIHLKLSAFSFNSFLIFSFSRVLWCNFLNCATEKSD